MAHPPTHRNKPQTEGYPKTLPNRARFFVIVFVATLQNTQYNTELTELYVPMYSTHILYKVQHWKPFLTIYSILYKKYFVLIKYTFPLCSPTPKAFCQYIQYTVKILCACKICFPMYCMYCVQIIALKATVMSCCTYLYSYQGLQFLSGFYCCMSSYGEIFYKRVVRMKYKQK